MKRSRQDVESELRSLSPKALSDRVVNRVAEELAPTRRRRLWDAWIPRAAVVLAVAASIAVVVFWWPQPAKTPVWSPSPSMAVAHIEQQPPTLLAYQYALGKSPDHFDNLLDRHAASLLVAGSPSDDIESLYQDLLPN